MKDILNLLRWKNLLVIFLALVIVKISIINPFYIAFGLGGSPISIIYYMFFVLGVLLIASGANVINDYFDNDIDLINRDEDKVYVGRVIKKENALKLFYVLSILGVVIHFLVGYKCHCIQIGCLSIVFVLMSYFYSLKYKRQSITGNIVIAFLYGAVIFMPSLMELFGLMNNKDLFKVLAPEVKQIGYVFLFFTVFTFILTFIRDIVKDMRNETGDRDCGAETFVIKRGEKATKTLLYVLTIVLIVFLGLYLVYYFVPLEIIQVIIISVIILFPLIYFLIELKKAKQQQDYDFLYNLLGMVFISLLFALSFVKYILINGLPA